jgi:uncharacterized protein (DUF305 family)|tara:strand:+ start:9204 stop:9554 length:351 start_codon:yes stop_codon:yes gene_type:complete
MMSIAAATVTATPALAQHSQMGGMAMPGMQGMQNMGPAQKELSAAMDRMNQAMMQGMMDPDPAKAWMKSMAAHHRGAIEMSQIIMRHTKNAEVLAEARKTVDDNQRALAELQAKMR